MPSTICENTYDFDFRDIVDAAKDVIIVTKAEPIDPPGPEIVYVNEAFTELTGYTPEQAIGKNPRILQSRETSPEAKKAIRKALEDKVPVRVSIKNYNKKGIEYWLDLSILPLRDKLNQLTHFVAIEREITEQKNLELKLTKLSNTDPLTGLLNRRAFDQRLSDFYQSFREETNIYSAIALDIDHFKSINDQYGHQAGDLVLRKLGLLCKQFFNADDILARTGGEEFFAIVANQNLNAAANRAEMFRREIAQTRVHTQEGVVQFTASFGVAEINVDHLGSYDILHHADQALYQAKHSGRNQVCSFSEELNSVAGGTSPEPLQS